MSEPRRLLSGASDASPLERQLLAAGRQRREHEGMPDRVRLGVAAVVAAGAISAATAANAATTATTAKATLTGSALAKAKIIVLAAALVTTAGATTYLVATNDHPTPAAASSSTVVVSPVTSIGSATAAPPITANDLPAAPPSATAVPQPRASGRPRHASRGPVDPPASATAPAVSEAQSELREEAILVDEARSALAAGALPTARDRLARADARFPHGRLAEEREALAVRVAAAGGETARASQLARAFLGRHPTSPLRPSIESIAKKDGIE